MCIRDSSCTIGDGVVMAGQVGLGDHVTIGPGVILGGASGVFPGKRLEGPGQMFMGVPAEPLKNYLKSIARVDVYKRQVMSPARSAIVTARASTRTNRGSSCPSYRKQRNFVRQNHGHVPEERQPLGHHNVTDTARPQGAAHRNQE